MNARDWELVRHLEENLLLFHREQRPLHGIQDDTVRMTFMKQVVDSVHRVKYISVLRTRNLSERRADPDDELFDPLKAAILHQRQEHIDEAFWLVFLFVHFGKHPRAGWRYAREIYGRLGDGNRWDWASTSADPSGFREWLKAHEAQLKRPGVARGFGNHRKYESLNACSSQGTGSVIESYVQWVNPPRTHQQMIAQALERANDDPHKAFDALYRSMNDVTRFGRLARFDYLTMVAKLTLAPIAPGSTYLKKDTGPFKGAWLLFAGHKTAPLSPTEFDTWLVELDTKLAVGMQVLEDALCNWQKSPREYKRFRG